MKKYIKINIYFFAVIALQSCTQERLDPVLTTAQWLGLTYSVGVGGSLLVIGSASGIIAMSKVPELTFVSYLKYVPALLLCYCLGYSLTLFLANHLHG